MPLEGIFVESLGEKISWLIFCLDGLNRDFSTIHIGAEMEKLVVKMLGSWPCLGEGCNCYSPRIVFKKLALDSWLNCANLETVSFHFLEELHNGDCLT